MFNDGFTFVCATWMFEIWFFDELHVYLRFQCNIGAIMLKF